MPRLRLVAPVVVGLATLLAGCITAASIAELSAVDRAAAEFNCSPEGIVVRPRPELSSRTFDVQACGHDARYTCLTGHTTHYASESARVACVREPTQ